MVEKRKRKEVPKELVEQTKQNVVWFVSFIHNHMEETLHVLHPIAHWYK